MVEVIWHNNQTRFIQNWTCEIESCTSSAGCVQLCADSGTSTKWKQMKMLSENTENIRKLMKNINYFTYQSGAKQMRHSQRNSWSIISALGGEFWKNTGVRQGKAIKVARSRDSPAFHSFRTEKGEKGPFVPVQVLFILQLLWSYVSVRWYDLCCRYLSFSCNRSQKEKAPARPTQTGKVCPKKMWNVILLLSILNEIQAHEASQHLQPWGEHLLCVFPTSFDSEVLRWRNGAFALRKQGERKGICNDMI